MSRAEYAQKAELKAALAFAHGIELIPIYEGTDWKRTMESWKKAAHKMADET